MNVSQLMTVNAVTCRPRDLLYEAASLMRASDVGSLPVVDDDGRLLGIVTDRDICLAAYVHDLPLREIPVSAAMTSRVFSIGVAGSIDDAVATMAERGVRRLPVVDAAGRVMGIVSLDDLAGAAAKSGSASSNRAVAATLAAVAGTVLASTDPI